jgi:uncharacterized protein YlzI (FlbEa/FlbD family)
VVEGVPVGEFNRTVVWVPLNDRKVETGSYGAMKHCGGKIEEIKCLGRVTVPVEGHLLIVQNWIKEILDKRDQFDEVVADVTNRLKSYSPKEGVDTLELDVYSAFVINGKKDEVFIYRNPSSFP